MTTTANLQLELLEVGALQKDASINTAFSKIDAATPICLPDAASAPVSTGRAAGSTYFNTTDNKVYWLRSNGSWVALT